MTSVTPTDAKGPPSTFTHPAEGTGGGGGGTCAGARSSGNNSNSPPGWVSPNYLKWSENLNLLLNDGTGVELLLKYLEQEDQDCFYMLRFWLAVRGSHQQPDQDHLNKCILAIYKGLFNKIKGGIRDDLRRSVTQRIRRAQSENKLLDAKVFAEACKVVENVMIDRMYPNFLSSDVYLNYVHDMQQNASTYVESFAKDELPKNFCQLALPIVNEDEELMFDAYRCRPGPGSVTYSTASTRLLHEQPHLRVHHLSYNPVSRQDSEVQSLSSGARTEDMPDLALDDATGVLGSTAGSTYVQKRRQMRINRNTDLVHIHEPRSSQPGIQEKACAPEPTSFMSTLLPKLEKLRQEKETLEYVGLKLDSIEEDAKPVSDSSAGLKPSEDDDDQDILDRHVSRVWNELTPKQSPSIGTPVRPKSPDTRRARSLHGGSTGSLKEAYSWAPSSSWSCYSGTNSLRRRDRDVASLFSSDSGNGTDRERHHRSLNKHKSVSECGGGAGPSYDPSYSGHYPSGIKTWTGSHRTMTDSGVSVAGSTGIVPSQRNRDRSGLTSWHVDRRLPNARSRSMFGSGSQIFDEKDAMSAHSRSIKNKAYHSKTKSEYQHPKSVPAQPFVADTSMPPYPYYSIDSQTTVEEVTRRLEEWKGTHGASELQSNAESQSSGSQKSTSNEPEFTSVVYNFADENVPYLLRVYNSPVTLRVFKDHAPKRGNFRYFFQTECEDLGGHTPIFVEVTENDRVLPLWKNKVISKITML